MALIKTDYGLVYNDDGSLCTTVRKDDVPFQGVSSFAVEEGTTNYAPVDITTWAKNNTDVHTTNQMYMGCPVYELGHIGISSEATLDNYIYYEHVDGAANVSYTGSVYVYIYESGISSGDANNTIWLWYSINRTIINLDSLPKNQWVRVSVHGETDDTNKLVRFRIDFDNTHMLIAAPQLEKKPFATSFVDGTRPGGQFKIPFTYNQSSIVITMLSKYNLYSHDNILFQIGEVGDSRLLANQRELFNVDDNGNPTYITYTLAEKEWHHYVFIRDGLTIKAYIDGTLAGTASIAASTYGPTLYIGNLRLAGYYINGLISNLLVAKYNPDFWTDEYIKYIYEQRIPFNIRTSFPLK